MLKCLINSILRILVVGIVSLVTAELFMRVAGRKPWRPPEHKAAVARYVEDQELGWVKAVGSFPLEGNEQDFPSVKYTFLPGNRRRTSDTNLLGRKRVALLGDSFVEGAGLPDEETLGWKLQKAIPEMELENYGTSGYGTLQSLRELDTLLSGPQLPDVVVYGAIDFHDFRNFGYWEWFAGMAAITKSGRILMPYCRLLQGSRLQCLPPQPYPNWYGRSYFALVPFLEELSIQLRTNKELSHAHKITQLLIREMEERSRTRGVTFLVAQLDAVNESKDSYLGVLREAASNVVSCIHEQHGQPGFVLASNGHPNGVVNSFWAECLRIYLSSFYLKNQRIRQGDGKDLRL